MRKKYDVIIVGGGPAGGTAGSGGDSFRSSRTLWRCGGSPDRPESQAESRFDRIVLQFSKALLRIGRAQSFRHACAGGYVRRPDRLWQHPIAGIWHAAVISIDGNNRGSGWMDRGPKFTDIFRKAVYSI